MDYSRSSLTRALEASLKHCCIASDFEFDEDYGLVHPDGCIVCLQYMCHLPEPSSPDVEGEGLRNLLEQRQRKEFAQGVNDGRYLQKLEDEARIQELEKRYKEAMDMLDSYSERFSIMCGDFAARVQRMADKPRRDPGPMSPSLHMPWSPIVEERPSIIIPPSHIGVDESLHNESPLSPVYLLSPESECDSLLSAPPSPQRDTMQPLFQELQYPESLDGSFEDIDAPASPYLAASPITVSDTNLAPTTEPPATGSIASDLSPRVSETPSPFSSTDSTAVSTPYEDETALINMASPLLTPNNTSSSATSLSPLPTACSSESPEAIKKASPLASIPELDFRDASLASLATKEFLFPPPSSRSTIPHAPTSLAELQQLMKKAHDGDKGALVVVKQFCVRSQSTATKKRSELQHYIITHWRRPSKKTKAPLPSVPSVTNTDMHVDASTSWGIGLVWGGKWLAWKLKPGWKVNGRDINWAELIAIEVGLLSAVATKPLPSRLTVKSDNQGVVRSIVNQTSKSPILQEVVTRILTLMQKHKLTLEVKWIKTDENPADGPSRGDLPPSANLLKTRPALPAHLKQVLDDTVMA